MSLYTLIHLLLLIASSTSPLIKNSNRRNQKRTSILYSYSLWHSKPSSALNNCIVKVRLQLVYVCVIMMYVTQYVFSLFVNCLLWCESNLSYLYSLGNDTYCLLYNHIQSVSVLL